MFLIINWSIGERVAAIGPISNFTCDVILDLCAKFGAFITKKHDFTANPPHYNDCCEAYKLHGG